MHTVQLRNLVIFALIIPLALILGLTVAKPLDLSSIAVYGLIFFAVVVPLMIKWQQAAVIVSWNATANAFFLPGQPELWMVLAIFSVAAWIFRRTLVKGLVFQNVPALTWPLVVLGLVLIATAILNGGLGFRSFGSGSYGARRYVLVVAAIIGYFALSIRPISPVKARRYASLFFLMGATAVISDLIYLGGSSLYFLYNFFPAHLALMQAGSDFSLGSVVRFEGLAWASVSIFCFMLVRFGIRGIFDLQKPWRLFWFLVVVTASLLGGFRGRVVLMGMIFAIQFFFEGLHRTRYLALISGFVLLMCALTLPFLNKMPLSVQRSLSFLPVDVDPAAKSDAQGTMEWRLDMWQVLYKQVPEYLWLGKGYTFDAAEHFLLDQAIRQGYYQTYESALLVGTYHNGPLTLILTFGIWGVIAFAWFCIAAIRSLYRNYKYGNPMFRVINAFLLSYFIARLIFFVFMYGQFAEDLFHFTGVLGLSIGINRGVARRKAVSYEKETEKQSLLKPALAS